MIFFSLQIILWQTVTPTPGASRPVDSGNDPAFTAIFYFIFMLIALGVLVGAARIRFNLLEKKREAERGKQVDGRR